MTEVTDPQHAGPGGALEAPLKVLEELLAVGPRLASRTRRQALVARTLASQVPCLGRWIPPSEQVRIPASEAPERLTVLDVLAEPEAEPGAVEPAIAPALSAVDEAPSAADLPVTDYDSLAASQVVPRLVTLSAEELAQVERYERAHRNRQTILNRIAQLQSS